MNFLPEQLYQPAYHDNSSLFYYGELHDRLCYTAEPMAWVFAGDSTPQGIAPDRGEHSYAELFQQFITKEWGIEVKKSRSHDTVIDISVDGESSADFLKDLPGRLAPFKANVVFLCFGRADALKRTPLSAYREQLAAIVTAVHRLGAIPVLQVPPPANKKGLGVLPRYAQAVRDVAAATETMLADHANHWKTAKPEWMIDGEHPNAEGHRAMADLLVNELGIV